MALNESVAENEIQVARILGKKKLSDNEKNERVRLVRQSMAEIKTGSVGTVFSIANQMIGSSIILYPV
jgi:predicted FMN-binding regulatory protein PaiB